MKCTHCLHFDICNEKSFQRMSIYTFMRDSSTAYMEGVEKRCEHFIDKRRLVKFPCNIEDTLYAYKTVFKKQERKRLEETIVEPVTIDRFILSESGVVQVETCNEENIWVTYSADEFGINVFLTREEAERKLEERK